MSNDGPNRVCSDKSLTVLVDGRRLEIQIYRDEESPTWTLEIVDDQGSSSLWENAFASDGQALEAVLTRLEEDGSAGLFDMHHTMLANGQSSNRSTGEHATSSVQL